MTGKFTKLVKDWRLETFSVLALKLIVRYYFVCFPRDVINHLITEIILLYLIFGEIFKLV